MCLLLCLLRNTCPPPKMFTARELLTYMHETKEKVKAAGTMLIDSLRNLLQRRVGRSRRWLRHRLSNLAVSVTLGGSSLGRTVYKGNLAVVCIDELSLISANRTPLEAPQLPVKSRKCYERLARWPSMGWEVVLRNCSCPRTRSATTRFEQSCSLLAVGVHSRYRWIR